MMQNSRPSRFLQWVVQWIYRHTFISSVILFLLAVLLVYLIRVEMADAVKFLQLEFTDVLAVMGFFVAIGFVLAQAKNSRRVGFVLPFCAVSFGLVGIAFEETKDTLFAHANQHEVTALIFLTAVGLLLGLGAGWIAGNDDDRFVSTTIPAGTDLSDFRALNRK